YFIIVNTHQPVLVIIVTLIGLTIIWPPITAVLGSMFSEAFSREVRYTVVAIGYLIGAASAGGAATLIALFLINSFNGSSVPVSLYIIMTAIVSMVAVWAIKGVQTQDLEYARDEAARSGHDDGVRPAPETNA